MAGRDRRGLEEALPRALAAHVRRRSARRARGAPADHGRGTGPEDWKHHKAALPESAANWTVVLGPDTPALGERNNTAPQTSAQIAATIGALLGLDYRAFYSQAAEPLKEVIAGR